MRAVARIAKLKGSGIAMSEMHTSRARDTPNANPDRPNQRLIGMPSIDGQMTLDTLDLFKNRENVQVNRFPAPQGWILGILLP
jgi:hypothetical protein